MQQSVRILSLTLFIIVVILVADYAGAECPETDLNGDCLVDIVDVGIFADQWLAPPDQEADFDSDEYVNMDDFTILAKQWHAEGVPLAINEVMASNGRTAWDERGEFEDWIELYNYGDEDIDMAGTYLTDNLSIPTKWRFPFGNPGLTTITAGGYLLVWADGDVDDPGLHAGFQLDAGGDQVALYDRTGTVLIDSAEFGNQTTDISYGRYADGSNSWFDMILPTPGGANIYFFEGVVEEPDISHERGFYEEPFTLCMATETEGARVYYTLDGSKPYASGAAINGKVYVSPIPISKTTCLRAVAVKDRWSASKAITHTYVFVEDVKRQSPGGEKPDPNWPSSGVNGQSINYGMDPEIVNSSRYRDLIDDALLAVPSFSIVTDLANLFDPVRGIYVNAKGAGRDWERPASIELIEPNDPRGERGFQIDAGIRIRGGASRSSGNPKHAFRFFFRAAYGKSKLEFPLFKDEGVTEFKHVDLRTSQNYSWWSGDRRNTMVREVFSRDAQGEMGQPYTRSRYYHLYINGHYWGLFQTQERAKSSFGESYLGGNEDDYDAVKTTGGNPDWVGYIIEATDGTLDAFRRLWQIASTGFDMDEPYYRVQGLNNDGTRNSAYERLLDVNNLIDYMIGIFYTGDFDAPISGFIGNRVPNNFHSLYNRVNPDGFKFFRHDAEHSLMPSDSRNQDRTGPYPAGEEFQHFNPQWLHQQIAEHPEYRMRFADRVHKYFFNGGIFTQEQSQERILRRAEQIETAIIAESARWGDSRRSSPFTKDDHWWPEINMLLDDYFPTRTDIVLAQFKSKGWYPGVVAPMFNFHGGSFPSGVTVTMDAPAGTIYYTLDGSDPRLPEKPAGGAVTTTLVAASDSKRVLVPNGPIDEAWRGGAAFEDSSWTLVTGNPGGIGYERGSGYESHISLDVEGSMYGKQTSCYVRIPFVVGSDPGNFDLMTLKVRYDDGFVAYLNGVEIERVLFSDTPQWDSQADGNHEDEGFEPFHVSQYLHLLEPGANVLAIQALNVGTTSSDFIISAELVAGEMGAGAGGGMSATAKKYTGPVLLDKSTQVKARALVGSSWSALNEAVFGVGPVAESLRISEIMYHPIDPGDPNDPNDPNEESIELVNIGPEAINLSLVKFTNGIDFTFGDVVLGPGQRTVVVEDVNSFELRYGIGLPIAGQYDGRLANNGERIELVDAVGTVIHDFRYEDGWRKITDTEGYSLTIIDANDPNDPNAVGWGEKDSWRASVYPGGSPGVDDGGILPEPGAIVINEVLAHSHDEASDWIELYNTTGSSIDIGGWYLSDSTSNLKKYRIAAGTTIGAGKYKVFHETTQFGSSSVDPGSHEAFAMSENGEAVYLSSAIGGELTGYREIQDFGASATGVSFGRYLKGSTGNYNFVPMSYPTAGQANAYPKVGPIVISEINYNPAWPQEGGPYTNEQYEYIELKNIGPAAVTLYRQDKGEPWKITDGVDFTFPGWPSPATIEAGDYLIIARKPEAFMSYYTGVPSEKVLGPYVGNLSNSGERVQLSSPGDVDKFGVRQYICEDRVAYSDGMHPKDQPGGIDLWPIEADGKGHSLQRLDDSLYGNDPNNWQAGEPSPGQ